MDNSNFNKQTAIEDALHRLGEQLQGVKVLV